MSVNFIIYIIIQHHIKTFKECMKLPKINKNTITKIRLVLILIFVVVSIELTRRLVKITSDKRLTRTVYSRRVDVVLLVDL